MEFADQGGLALPTGTPGALIDEVTSLGAWKDVIWERFVSLQIAPSDASALTGTVHTRQIGHLTASAVASTPQTFTRTPRLLSHDNRSLLQVGLVERGTGHLEQDGRTCTLTDGDFALYETARPFTWSLAGDWRLLVFTWPRETVPLSDAEGRRLTAHTLCSREGVGLILSPMLGQLVMNRTGLSVANSARLADEIAELTITAALEAGHVDQTTGETDLFQRVRAYIETHLDNPALGPQRIAQEFFLSPRTLHRLFARHDLTVHAWIKERRLEASRHALTAPGSQHSPVTEVATRYGFRDAAVFSRAFSRAYGASPSRYRMLHVG
ncbi:helix-turn-helix domain-containing protein [Streptomyces acidicola]|uniref:Helix-turn-helix domain-containing protein n=1 Tax=Streptomyces acidicola TaxID=2596892 RepID=A0A5N8X128_9ACTN|nr:helix-turn-helix domain-containing protein [Streptomyces acidicola]MPY53249.1 helix-turn-helix domain-containing protein [Streptomyces acidicola]